MLPLGYSHVPNAYDFLARHEQLVKDPAVLLLCCFHTQEGGYICTTVATHGVLWEHGTWHVASKDALPRNGDGQRRNHERECQHAEFCAPHAQVVHAQRQGTGVTL